MDELLVLGVLAGVTQALKQAPVRVWCLCDRRARLPHQNVQHLDWQSHLGQEGLQESAVACSICVFTDRGAGVIFYYL